MEKDNSKVQPPTQQEEDARHASAQESTGKRAEGANLAGLIFAGMYILSYFGGGASGERPLVVLAVASGIGMLVSEGVFLSQLARSVVEKTRHSVRTRRIHSAEKASHQPNNTQGRRG